MVPTSSPYWTVSALGCWRRSAVRASRGECTIPAREGLGGMRMPLVLVFVGSGDLLLRPRLRAVSAMRLRNSRPPERPMPRSMRLGWSASSRPNSSTIDRAVLCPLCTPPDPRRMEDVSPATWAIRTAGDVPATPGLR